MRGFELIPIAAGATIALVGFLTLLNGVTIARQAETCAVGNQTQCERQAVIGQGTLRVVPYFFASATFLVGLGASLILFRRWYRPAGPDHDEGPPYP